MYARWYGGAEAFVQASTRLRPVPLVPELRLHVADEVFALWERTEAIGPPVRPLPFWAFAWPGGIALARHLLDRPGLARGRYVLDVGAGSGLVGIAAALAGAAQVVASEVDVLAAAALALNAAANGVTLLGPLGDVLGGSWPPVKAWPNDAAPGRPSPPLDPWPTDGSPGNARPSRDPWPAGDGTAGGDASDRPVPPPLVLAADLFYEQPLAARVLPFLDRARAAGAEVMIGDPGRAYLPRERLEPLATYDVPSTWATERGATTPTTVYRLLPPI